MKKLLMVLALVGFGMTVGCSDDTTTKKTSGTSVTVTKPSGTSTSSTETKTTDTKPKDATK